MKFLVFQLGCMECSVSSYPIKVCETFEQAKEVQVNHPDTWESEGGEGRVLIIDLEKCEEVERRKCRLQ